MEPARLRALLEAYGAEPARWPEEERAAAQALVAAHPELRTLQGQEAALDAALVSETPAVPEALLARVLAIPTEQRREAAVASRLDVDAPAAVADVVELPRRVAPAAKVSSTWWPFDSWGRPLATLAAAAAVGLWLGSVYDVSGSSASLGDTPSATQSSAEDWSSMSALALATHLDSEDPQ